MMEIKHVAKMAKIDVHCKELSERTHDRGNMTNNQKNNKVCFYVTRKGMYSLMYGWRG